VMQIPGCFAAALAPSHSLENAEEVCIEPFSVLMLCGCR
jgi:hypothetical protein